MQLFFSAATQSGNKLRVVLTLMERLSAVMSHTVTSRRLTGSINKRTQLVKLARLHFGLRPTKPTLTSHGPSEPSKPKLGLWCRATELRTLERLRPLKGSASGHTL